MRDAERSWKAEFKRGAEARLQAMAAAASELLEGCPRDSAGLSAALVQQVTLLRGTLGAHAEPEARARADVDVDVDDKVEAPGELDALIAKLRDCYEALAAALQEDAIHVPRLRPTNYLRNLFHVGWGLFGAALVLGLSAWPWVLVAAALTFAVASWTMEISRRRSPAINAKLMALFRHVSHPHEAHQVNSSTWYASALALLALTREPTVMTIGVLVLAFADPAAAVIGRRFGRIKLVNNRTLEGTLTFAVVGGLATFAVLSLVGGTLLPTYAFGVRLAIALTAGTLGAIAELFSRRIDDNFSIPVTSALGAWVVLLLTV